MRIYLAGTYNGLTRAMRKTIEGQPKYLLNTFFEGEKICFKALDEVGNENFLLDSGAFSFMNGAKATKDGIREYQKRYINFINKNKVKYFFEIDVDTIFGLDFVEELREELERETGRPCIPVWHKGRGVEYYKKMCQDYEYIAIGGLAAHHIKQQEYPLIQKMVCYARRQRIKVHGLGFTKTKILPNYPFYSVDSAAWARSAAFGAGLNIFDGEKIISRTIKSNYKAKTTEARFFNLKEWIKYQKYMDQKPW